MKTSKHKRAEAVHLGAELEINHHDADLGAGDHQDDEDQEQEAEEVIKLVLPDGLLVSRTGTGFFFFLIYANVKFKCTKGRDDLLNLR